MIPGRIGRLLCSRFCVGIFDTSELLRFCERSRNSLTRSYILNNSTNNRNSILDDILCAYSCKSSYLCFWITITWRESSSWRMEDRRYQSRSFFRTPQHFRCSQELFVSI
jgi:hypothetical protein